MIRDFHADDVESIRKLLSRTPEAARWYEDDFLSAFQRNFNLRIAEEGGCVCGLVAFRVMADEAEILNLAVDSSRRRRGLGSLLVEHVIAACKSEGATRVFLEVRDSNRVARDFYARMGFAEAGRRRQYYRHPVEDALVLVRTIDEG
jgi:[ribosomal protein S18]-alanine N-acetyltransferase